MIHSEHRQAFYRRLSALYPQGELQSIYHWCVQEIHGWNRAELYLKNEDKVDQTLLDTWERATLRLEAGMPVQYVFGSSTFYGLEFKVDKSVLIPRPETEELVSLVLERNDDSPKKVVDIGTGSGCIAIALKSKRSQWSVQGIDVSSKALELAETNAVLNDAAVQFLNHDVLLSDEEIGGEIWVSNPPYIPADKPMLVDNNVLKFEPHIALFAPDNDPFVFFRVITKKAMSHGVKQLYFETHATEMDELTEILSGLWKGSIERKKDSAQKERFLVLSV